MRKPDEVIGRDLEWHVLERLLRADDAVFGIFSRTGFTPELRTAAENRPDLTLIDLERLYSSP